MKKMDFIFIILLFYVGWFGSVFCAKADISVASLIFPLALLGFLILKKNLSLQDLKQSICILFVGVLFDFMLVRFKFISIQGDSTGPVPIWLISIWLLFSFSIIKISSKLQIPIWAAALLGGLMGPLSYKSGELFQILTFSSSSTFLIYAVFWSFSFPIILNLSKRPV